MGLVVNKILDDIDFLICSISSICVRHRAETISGHFGGPSKRDAVSYCIRQITGEATMVIDEQIALTATTVCAISRRAMGKAVCARLLRLGSGQLDAEIQADGWLSVDADPV